MLRAIHTILVQMMTDKAGETDPFRVWGVVGFISLIGYTGWGIYLSHGFDPVNYGGAVAAYLTGWGAGILAKGKGEN